MTVDAIYPANVVDLQRWKAQLPTGSAGNPAEVLQPSLSTYTDAAIKVSGYGVAFRANVEGFTLPSSKYPRSELREMSADGKTQASWNPAVGRHTLTLLQQINKLPAVKKDVVVAQVHDSTFNYILEVIVRGNPDGLTAQIIASPINPATDSKGTDVVLVASHKLGDTFRTHIEAANGHIKILGSSFDLPWSTTGCYFKAGCYTQSNLTYDAPGEYAEVLIRQIAVTHEP